MTMVNRFFMKQVMERIAKLEKQVAQLQEDAKRVEPATQLVDPVEYAVRSIHKAADIVGDEMFGAEVKAKRGPGRPRKVES